MEENKKKKSLMTQGQLIMRVLVGGYLDYLAYDLFKERATSSINPIVLWIVIIFFTIAGTYFLGMALILYYRGEYKGGKKDPEMEGSEVKDTVYDGESIETDGSEEIIKTEEIREEITEEVTEEIMEEITEEVTEEVGEESGK